MRKLKSVIITGLLGGVSVYVKGNKTVIYRQVANLTAYLPIDLGSYIKTGSSIDNIRIKLNSKGYKKLQYGFIVIQDGDRELGRIQITKGNKTKAGWQIDDISKQLEQYNQGGDFY